MKTKKPKLSVEINDDVAGAIEFLKSEYAINISAFIRKSILDLKKKMESDDA